VTRKSKREIERKLEELRPDDDIEPIEPIELTAKEKHRLVEILEPGDDIYNPDDGGLEEAYELLAEANR